MLASHAGLYIGLCYKPTPTSASTATNFPSKASPAAAPWADRLVGTKGYIVPSRLAVLDVAKHRTQQNGPISQAGFEVDSILARPA